MPFFTNFFLLLYLLDAELSIVDETLSLISTSHLTDLRMLLANLVLLLSLPMYLSIGIRNRLPKRLFLPLPLYVLWCPLSIWFIPSLIESKPFGLVIALVQLALFALPLRHIRSHGGQSFLLTNDMLTPQDAAEKPWGFLAASVVVIPVTFILFGFASLNAYIEAGTAGFVHFRPNGLYMTEKVYRKDNKTIRLIGMIHVGEKEYYDNLVKSISSSSTVVLAEGVSDEKGVLKNRFTYGKVASLLGLTSQDKVHFKGRLVDDEEDKDSGREGNGEVPDIIRADVDLSTFTPTTIHFLNVLGRYLTTGTSVVQQLTAFYDWEQKNFTPEMNEIVMNDILYGRNKEVVAHLDKALPQYQTIVIPWGALHMAGIEEAVVKRGFVQQGKKERESIDFFKVLTHRPDQR